MRKINEQFTIRCSPIKTIQKISNEQWNIPWRISHRKDINSTSMKRLKNSTGMLYCVIPKPNRIRHFSKRLVSLGSWLIRLRYQMRVSKVITKKTDFKESHIFVKPPFWWIATKERLFRKPKCWDFSD